MLGFKNDSFSTECRHAPNSVELRHVYLKTNLTPRCVCNEFCLVNMSQSIAGVFLERCSQKHALMCQCLAVDSVN